MKKTLTLLIALFFCIQAFAQIPVKGRVVDADGEPLPGVVVMQKSSGSMGAMTDENGNFSLSVSSADAVLLFTLMGYQDAEEPVGAKRHFNVTLKDDTTFLDEAVVVGYGVQKRASVTGSVASVQAKDLVTVKSANVTNALAGKLPGLRAVQRSGAPAVYRNGAWYCPACAYDPEKNGKQKDTKGEVR